MIEATATVALLLISTSVVIEVIAIFTTNYSIRRMVYALILLLTSFAMSALLSANLSVLSGLVGFIAFYRLLNAMRVLAGRVHERQSLKVVRRTSLYLASAQAMTVVLYISLQPSFNPRRMLYVCVVAALAAGALMALAVRRNMRGSQFTDTALLIDNELPSISVCIPARNETAELAGCLESILASDYPKLEVLVLDDCSQDNTSEIIKGFAQKGVRWLAGDPPQHGWLAKNQAYQSLTQAASGEVLVFCGIDVRFQKSSLRQLVTRLQQRNKQMISVMPYMRQREDNAYLLQPLRYWWELALPRRFFNRPPVLSSCWLIRADTLHRLHRFQAVKNTVLVEAYFARALTIFDGYSFVRSSGDLRVDSIKIIREQWETAQRNRYPQIRKRLEVLALIAFAEITLFIIPISLFILGFFIRLGWLWPLAGFATLLLAAIYYKIISACKAKHTGTVMALLPAALCVDFWLLHLSMWRYEFGAVLWKDRNICIPVMHVISRLPPA